MGLCRDFGSQIAEGCDHPMRAGSDSCQCEQCGVVCTGKFKACPSVWARGPQPLEIVQAPSVLVTGLSWDGIAGNGHEPDGLAAPDAPSATPGTVGSPDGSPGVAETMGTNGPAVGAAASGSNGLAPDGGLATSHPVASVAAPSTDHPPAPAGVTGGEVFRWFQNAFDALRLEVEGLRSALSQEQALVLTLLERRGEDELDADVVREVVSAAVQKAVGLQAAELRTVVEGLRHDLEAVRRSQDESVAGLQASIAGVAEAGSGSPAALNRRDSGNRKAFRVTLVEELRPLIDVVAESVAQSEYQLEALGRRIDKLDKSGASLTAALAEVKASLAALAEADPSEEAPDSATRGAGTSGNRISLPKRSTDLISGPTGPFRRRSSP